MLLLEKLEQKRKYIISIMIICLISGIIYSCFCVEKRNTSESVLMLVEKEEKSENDFTNKGNLNLSKKMVSNFEEIIKSDSSIILLNESLKTNMNINELRNEIQVKLNSNSDTFKIIVENKNLDLSLKINKELIKIFSNKLKTIYTNTEVYIVDNARIEENINYVSIIKVMIISIILGTAINAIYVIYLINIDKKIKRTNDLESEFALKTLGNIPINKNKNKLVARNEKTAFSKAFKILRSNIQFINVNNKEKNTILVTSSKKQEGKSIISANIAITFAKTGKKVILIDADMNSGKIGKIFNLPNDLGLSNYLSGIDENGVEVNERINKFIKDTTVKNLNVITSGTVPPNSSELLSMPKLEETIKDLSVFYDFIIFDTTAVLNETDALILTRLVNSTIIVCNYKKTKKDDLWRTKRDIQNVGGRIIGTIINKVKIKEENENKYAEIKQIVKDRYSKIKDYIVTKIDNRKQKLLEAAIIEEKQKVAQELKIEENKLIEEIKKEKLEEEIKSEEKETKNTILNTVTSSLKQITNIVKQEPKEDEKVSEIEEVVKPEKETISKPISKEEKNIKEEIKECEIEKQNNFDISKVKENVINFSKMIKEKTSNAVLKVNETVKREKEKIDEIKKESKEKKIEKIKEEVAQEKIKESKELIRENTERIEMENVLNEFETEISKAEKDENAVLVIVDAENGYCRAFSQYCFTEKLIRGIDKTDGFVKANYSTSTMNRKKLALSSKYELTKKQLERIDTLIYTVLKEYDECVWLERKMISNKADDYVFCMAKEYEKSEGETKPNYELRCQYLRKVELAKAQIEIEYKLDNLWSSEQINFTDKIVFYNLAQKYENLKEKRKNEERENPDKKKEKSRGPLNLLKKIKIDEVKVKSIEELTKEVTENQNDYDNYQFEDYKAYDNYNNKFTEQDLEEQRIKQEQEEMLLEQIRLKQELKDKKITEKNQKKEERIRRREEKRKSKEMKKQKAKEEARIKEELLVDNLYPKTKYNKNL